MAAVSTHCRAMQIKTREDGNCVHIFDFLNMPFCGSINFNSEFPQRTFP